MRLAAIIAAFLLPIVSVAQQPGSKPNIVVIWLDNASPVSFTDAVMPLEMPVTYARLKQQGITYLNYQLCSGYCSPTRATRATGLLPQNTVPGGNGNTNVSVITRMAHVGQRMTQIWMKRAGYFTGLIGKWGNPDYAFEDDGTWSHPPLAGYDVEIAAQSGSYYPRRYGIAVGTGDERRYEIYNPPACLSLTQATERHMIETLDEGRNSGKPIFLELMLKNPHKSPTRNNTAWTEKVITYCDTAFYSSWMDEGTGKHPQHIAAAEYWKGNRDSLCNAWLEVHRATADVDRIIMKPLFDWLDSTGQIDNTVILFTTDNGRALGELGIEGLINPYTENYNVPLIVRAPWITGGRELPTMIGHTSAVATCLDLAGMLDSLADWSGDTSTIRYWIDGKSFLHTITDGPVPVHAVHQYFYSNGGGSQPAPGIFFEDYDIIASETLGTLIKFNYSPVWYEYYTAADRRKLHNLYSSPAHATAVAELQAAMAARSVGKCKGPTCW